GVAAQVEVGVVDGGPAAQVDQQTGAGLEVAERRRGVPVAVPGAVRAAVDGQVRGLRVVAGALTTRAERRHAGQRQRLRRRGGGVGRARGGGGGGAWGWGGGRPGGPWGGATAGASPARPRRPPRPSGWPPGARRRPPP